MNYIIYVSNIVKKEFENLKDVAISIYGEDYFSLTKRERTVKRLKLAQCQKILEDSDFPIINTKIGVLDSKNNNSENYSLSNSIIIDNEVTHLCSMCYLKQITFFEKCGHNELVSEKLEKKYAKDGYVKINNDEILQNIIKDYCDKEVF